MTDATDTTGATTEAAHATGVPEGAFGASSRPVQFEPEPPGSKAPLHMTVLAQDPSVTVGGRVLRASVPATRERLEPGPRGPRFWVLDYDGTSRRLVAPSNEPLADVIATCEDAALATDPRVRAQNVYLVAARTLAAFEEALGRRLGWGFAGHQLYLVPAAFAEPNAFYDPDSNAIFFGYFTSAGDDGVSAGADPVAAGAPGDTTAAAGSVAGITGNTTTAATGPAVAAAGAAAGVAASPETVYAALSHDVVAHETTHAILDGLRRRFEEPSLPDQAAFHEALADIVALMSVFSLPETVLALVPGDPATGLVDPDEVRRGVLVQTALLGLAEQFGSAVHATGGALRRSVTLAARPGLLAGTTLEEPHARGEVLVAAAGNAMLSIWTKRLVDLHAKGSPLHRTRVAEEGAKSAAHLLSMSIRAIDYLPPVDLSFGDFLTAMLAADADVVPDDVHGYRETLVRSFHRYGIHENAPRRVATFGRSNALSYRQLHDDELRIRRDEVYRLLWENAEALEIPTEFYLSVETVTPCARVAPDGFVVRQVVATYAQVLDGTAAELEKLAARRGGRLVIPAGVSPHTRVELLGGGTVILDEFARLVYHQPKPLLDWDRQSRRLDYLVRHGLRDAHGGVGYSQGLALGLALAAMHAENMERLGETW